jgi:hypothetical protein
MTTITIIPEALLSAVNHTYVLLGMAPKADSHGAAVWQDAKGRRYAVSAGAWTDTQIGGVKRVAAVVQGGADIEDAILAYPLYSAFHSAYGHEGVALVGKAAAAFDFWDGGEVDRDPARILAMQHDNPRAALALAGIGPIPSDD